ncbi:argininosuccinate lyase [Pendulispora albinea]|uniref:Argininosuccinate lyase n=1 Tax=Pendulispora albinea TaxID=2741071 RepID=A0ABZ2LZ97_9BACT
MIAKTAAAGGPTLLPEVLAFTSSLALDRALIREDLVGSLAHLTMLSRRGIVPQEQARAIRDGLVSIWDAAQSGDLQLPDEEDVHMAVESLLTAKLGPAAGALHAARSRNDQVALDLRLYVREQCAEIFSALSRLIGALVERAEVESGTILPSYTHRQRAQPISLSYLLAAYGAMFTRDVDSFGFVLSQTDASPLGVGAIAGTSLPIDRQLVRELLAFGRLTANGLDTVGDRDFALDYAYAASRLLVHTSRVATDFVDFSTSEFGFVRLDGAIACGSSMMPQKRNPDLFELVRGKAGAGIGNLVTLLVDMKGLPGGYNRDQQEDRAPILATGPLVRGVLDILQLGLSRVTFDKMRCLAAVEQDATQATDVAEALVQQGLPFRTAYQLAGTLVRACQDARVPLAHVTTEMAQAIDPRLNDEVLQAARVRGAVARKTSPGGTGPDSVREQLEALRESVTRAKERAESIPRLSTLFAQLREAPL